MMEYNIKIGLRETGCQDVKVDETGSSLCPMSSFGIGGTETLGSATRELIG
jgi:hypothetical protein